MPDDTRRGYPTMPTPHWWSLRRKFRASIPREVTNNYLASALGMSERSAAANIAPSLRTTGIIDKDNKPTELAVRWRDDAQYAEVCRDIWEQVYPQELRELAPDGSVSRRAVQMWLGNHTGIGESGSTKMASFYLLLLDADITKNGDAPQALSGAKPAYRPTHRGSASKQARSQEGRSGPATKLGQQADGTGKRRFPDLNVNVQIHIASDASAEQIDQIFASMGKHLKDFES